jgi:hypothetical protein
LTADRRRTPSRQHPVQGRHTDRSLGLLSSEAAGSEPRSDQRLVTAHFRFNQRSLAVAGGDLPSQSTPFRDYLQMAVPLCRPSHFAAGNGRRPWWYHHLDVIVVCRDRLVGGSAIIRAIGCRPTNPVINLTEQRRHLGRIVGILIPQGLRHDHPAGSVDRQMQLAPRPARLRAMFRLQPLARSVDLQPGAIDQHVHRAARHRGRLDHRQF